MKEIKAIIKPFKLDDVVSALHNIEDLPGITISEIKGFGRSKGKDTEDAIKDGLHNYVKKIKIELVVKDDIVDDVVKAIQENAHTGNPGDGKIFIIDVLETIRIRTGETGEDAI